MSSLNYLHKLLDSVEVAWRPLADVVEFKRGEQLKPIDIVPGSYPIVTASKTEVGSHSEWNFGPLSVTVTSHGAYAGHVNYWPTPIWLANNVFLLSPISQLNPKFLYFFLKSNELKIQGLAKGGGVPYFNTRDLAPLLIPIPSPDNPKKSLEIQAEIVRILDAFTSLTAELTAELTARKKQYNYYRDQLLSFEEGEVVVKPLGEVYKFQYGMGNTIPTLGGEYPVYGSNGIVGTHNEFNSEDSPVIGHIGAYAGIVNWGAGKHYVTYNGVICKLINKLVHPKYAYYQLLKQDFNSMAKSASHPFVSYDALNKVTIPIPSLAEQERIVAILDKFDALTHSLTEGLPREIELRQKQYEYYRDLLLGFPKDHPALTGTPPEEGNVFGVSVAENRSAPVFPSSGGVPEGRGGSL